MTNPDEKDLLNRRAKLDAALADKKSKKFEEVARTGSGNAGWGLGVKISSEFIAGIIVGAGLGYLLDSVAGTAPWGMIIMLMLGFGAGVLNVLRATGKVAQPDNGVSGSASRNSDNKAGNSETEKEG